MKIFLKISCLLMVISIFHTHYKAFKEEVTNFANRRNDLNELGKFVYSQNQKVEKFFPSENISVFFGADKPFLFYSPNISDIKYDLIFKSDKNQSLKLFTSIDGKIRLESFQFRLLMMQNKKNESKIIEYFCRNLFNTYKKIKKINISIVMKNGKNSKIFNRYEVSRNN